jgi:hypothetical protein
MLKLGYGYGYGYERAYFTYKDLCPNQLTPTLALFFSTKESPPHSTADKDRGTPTVVTVESDPESSRSRNVSENQQPYSCHQRSSNGCVE